LSHNPQLGKIKSIGAQFGSWNWWCCCNWFRRNTKKMNQDFVQKKKTIVSIDLQKKTNPKNFKKK